MLESRSLATLSGAAPRDEYQPGKRLEREPSLGRVLARTESKFVKMSDYVHRSFHGDVLCRIASAVALIAGMAEGRLEAQSPTFAGNAQHTAQFSTPAQRLNRVRWSTVVNTAAIFDGYPAHFSAPLITRSNTALVSVTLNNGVKINAFDAATGRLKYTLTNDYYPFTLPGPASPVFEPVIVNLTNGPRLYYAGDGATVYYVDRIDSDSPTAPVQQCFYTDLASYKSNASAFNSSAFTVTPLTADTNGNIFFGFYAFSNAPAPLVTNQGGFVRIGRNGNATYVLARDAAGTNSVSWAVNGSAPALSNSGDTLYATAGPGFSYTGPSYLLGLDSTTLRPNIPGRCGTRIRVPKAMLTRTALLRRW